MNARILTLAALAAALAAPAVATATPALDTVPTRPTLTRSVTATHAVALPARVCGGTFSDYHVYGGASGRAFVGQTIGSDGIIWSTRAGRVVASLAFDDCKVRAFGRRPVTFAAWREETR